MSDLYRISREVEKSIINSAITPNSSQENILIASLMAGLGGTLPTLCRITASISSDFNYSSLFTLGVAVALSLYFIIGFISCLGFGEKRRREGFILGISAPAIIFSFISGLSFESEKKISWSLSLFPQAYAKPIQESPNINESEFWQDFKWAIGINKEQPKKTYAFNKMKSELKEIGKTLDKIKDEKKILKIQIENCSEKLEKSQKHIQQGLKTTQTDQNVINEEKSNKDDSYSKIIDNLSSEIKILKKENSEMAENINTYTIYNSPTGDIDYSSLFEIRKLLSDDSYFLNKKAVISRKNDLNITALTEDRFTLALSEIIKKSMKSNYLPINAKSAEPFTKCKRKLTMIYGQSYLMDAESSMLCDSIVQMKSLFDLVYEIN